MTEQEKSAAQPHPESHADQIVYSDQSIHAVMEAQVKEMLERADLSEEQKQLILASLSCPCCGSGGVSLSVKLKD